MVILHLNPLRVATFFEEVASQTGIGVERQHLLYLGHELPLEGSMKVVNLPHTSPTQPLTLLGSSFEQNHSLPVRERKTSQHTCSLFTVVLRRDERLLMRCLPALRSPQHAACL